MATYTRLAGTNEDAAVRCDDCSGFDLMGFALQAESDPAGVRCWTPLYGDTNCGTCGAHLGRRA